MNTTSKIFRNVSAALVVGLTLTGAVYAATPTVSGKDARSAERPVQQTCGSTVKYIGRDRSAVTVRECTPARKVKYWVGPRNTIPVYEER